jgi:glucans biosynthesis protein
MITATGIVPIPFSPVLFDYGSRPILLPTDTSFAGFRITCPMDAFGEVGSFLGVSYFRMIGGKESYGTSARGLGVDVMDSEEFPVFRQFWVRRTDPRAESVKLYALLDSPSISGAFALEIRPGTSTVSRIAGDKGGLTRMCFSGVGPPRFARK